MAKRWTKTVKLTIDDVAIIQTMIKTLYPLPKPKNDADNMASRRAANGLTIKIENAEWS